MKSRIKRVVWITLLISGYWAAATVSPAQTNSYISATDGFWDEARLWSLAEPPSITQSGIYITNAASVTVTIDSITANSFPSTLTISNLTILPSGNTDTLYLDNTGTTALHILDALSIGFNSNGPSGGASALISSNSTLVVDGSLGGQLSDDGSMVFIGGSLIATNCSLLVGVSSFYSEPGGTLILSNSVTQARDVTIAAHHDNGGIEVIGGSMTMTLLSINTGDESSSGNMLVANGAMVAVIDGGTSIGGGFQSTGNLTVSDASFSSVDLSLGGASSSGALVINDGTVTLNGQLFIGGGDESEGEVHLNGGLLVVTNGTTTVGGDPGIGRFTMSDGVFLGQSLYYDEGSFGIGGGTSIFSSNLTVVGFSTASISGGQLFVTNGAIVVDIHSEYDVSGGLLAAQTIELGIVDIGTLSVSGGSVTVSTGMTMGSCGVTNSVIIGYGLVTGGQLIVTNASHSAYIDAQNGQLTLSSGTLQVDQLVMTNSCSTFIHTGGTLIVGSVILDPNAFRIVSATRQSNDVLVSWLMAPGATNALQASNGTPNGSYTTNTFTDIFIVTNNTTTGTLTNFLDLGAATNKSRYYRARLSL